MPRSYAPQFRAKVVEQVRSGRSVDEVAAALELPPATVFGGSAKTASTAVSSPVHPPSSPLVAG